MLHCNLLRIRLCLRLISEMISRRSGFLLASPEWFSLLRELKTLMNDFGVCKRDRT